jgi:AraC-like DNA-binding protein
MSFESKILGIPISNISKIVGKPKASIGRIARQKAFALGLREPTADEISSYSVPDLVLNKDAGAYAVNSKIKFNSIPSNATIYYTTDGTEPTPKSPRYVAEQEFTLLGRTDLKYFVYIPGYIRPSVVTKTYTIAVADNTLSTPTLSYTGDALKGEDVFVTITSPDAGSIEGIGIYYTDDGTNPETSETKQLYRNTLTIMAGSTKTIKALASKSGYTSSGVVSATYGVTILGTLTNPRITLSGTENEAGEYINNVTLTAAYIGEEDGVSLYYTTDDTTPSANNGTLYDRAITFSDTDTVKFIAIASGYQSSAVVTTSFTIGEATVIATPTITIAGSAANGTTHTGDKTVSFASTTAGVTFYYTTNGTTPTISSSSGNSFTTSGSATVKVLAVKANYTNSAVASATYTITVPTPSFSAGTGLYTGDQSITLSDSLAGVTILYKIGSGTYNTYTGAFNTAGSATYTAYATKSGYADSAMIAVTYTIKLAAPTLSYASATVANDFNLTMSAPAGSTIRYTTNGTTPDSNSNIYSGAITVSGTQTIKAIAQKSGYTDSSVSSGVYTFVVANPTFDPVDGSEVVLNDVVTISTITTGATIRYTTDGTTPNDSSDLYRDGVEITV